MSRGRTSIKCQKDIKSQGKNDVASEVQVDGSVVSVIGASGTHRVPVNFRTRLVARLVVRLGLRLGGGSLRLNNSLRLSGLRLNNGLSLNSALRHSSNLRLGGRWRIYVHVS